MKLVFAIVQKEDTKPLIRALIEHEISVTRISSVGGFLSGGNTTLMIGVEADRLQTALDVIREKSSRRHSVTVPSTGIAHPIEAAAPRRGGPSRPGALFVPFPPQNKRPAREEAVHGYLPGF